MSDGHRTMDVVLTNAQWDVFEHAMGLIMEQWLKDGDIRTRDRHTLIRAMDRMRKAWEIGKRY